MADDVVLAVDEQGEAALEALLADMHVVAESVKPKWTLPDVVGEYKAVSAWPGYFTRPMKARQEIQLMALVRSETDRTAADSVMMSMSTASLILFKAELPIDAAAARAEILAHVRGDKNIFRSVTADEIVDTWTSEEVIDNVLRPMGYWDAEIDEVEVPNE